MVQGKDLLRPAKTKLSNALLQEMELIEHNKDPDYASVTDRGHLRVANCTVNAQQLRVEDNNVGKW